MSSEAEKAAEGYADKVYRNAGCSPNTDGLWHRHRSDFLAGYNEGFERCRAEVLKVVALDRETHGYGCTKLLKKIEQLGKPEGSK